MTPNAASEWHEEMLVAMSEAIAHGVALGLPSRYDSRANAESAFERWIHPYQINRRLGGIMTLTEIISMARSIARTMRNGLQRACHYLKSLNLPAEFACWALRGALA